MIQTAFLEEGIDILCHGAITPRSRYEAKQAYYAGGRKGLQPYLGKGNRTATSWSIGDPDLGLRFLDSRAEVRVA
jgi:hypothetical protein